MLSVVAISFNSEMNKMKHKKVKYVALAMKWAGGRVRKRKAVSSDLVRCCICQTALLSEEATLYS